MELKKMIPYIALAANVISAGATLVSGWAGNKMTEEMVEEKVNEALARYKQDKSGEV